MHCRTAGGMAVILRGVLVPWHGELGLGVLGGAELHGRCVGAWWCSDVRSRK